MQKKALEYGKLACDTMMRKFAPEELPPKHGFHYHQGVFLSGMMNVYSVCKEEKYFEYVKQWVDSIVVAPQRIKHYNLGALDDYMAGILLFPLYERTGDKKYSETLHMLLLNIRNWRKNEFGGFWHMIWLDGQMWLDGLYMAGPLQAIYAKKFNKPEYINEASNQAFLMCEHMQDKKTKLLYHAWDANKEMPWADKETGLAPEFWGRALGWYVVSVLDIMEQMDANSAEYNKLAAIEKEILEAVLSCRDKEKKLWYQVVDKGHLADNWVEASCSCLFTYAAAKAVRMGVIDKKYRKLAEESFDAVIENFVKEDDGNLTLSGVCVGTGVMDYKGYIDRPTSKNDLHGMGAFLLMCAELAR